MSDTFVELLWSWISLVEKRLSEVMAQGATSRELDDAKREIALAQIHGAIVALGFAIPTVDELREQWSDAERRGRSRVTGEPPITEPSE